MDFWQNLGLVIIGIGLVLTGIYIIAREREFIRLHHRINQEHKLLTQLIKITSSLNDEYYKILAKNKLLE
jgi:hypothetical protein